MSNGVSARLSHSQRIYDVVFVVVAFSVTVQGSLVPTVARWCRISMRSSAVEPWALGIRLRHRPESAQQVTVQAGSSAEGTAIADLDLGEHVWISFVVRDGRLLAADGSTRLRPDDELLLLADPGGSDDWSRLFISPPPPP
ncbi:hypothetical protein JS756_32695 [Streptomyces actuosus]|uniref:RCK C-terminal domain-containing protein n=1 Tax=Streptomyces actuosus TaxID=1885 RepID=A0ABS2W035_STRAS|nr:TrkA C-terminal domain-containing protein [Streptomyces actuosus]MBN0048759.1 hypothetical protein [Streptomyces actuosus]